MTLHAKSKDGSYMVVFENKDKDIMAVYDSIINFLMDTEMYSGESVMQSDVDMREVLSDIVDGILKPRVERE